MKIPPVKLSPYLPPKTHCIGWNDWLDAAFPLKRLPSNSYIQKGRCGIGGTTMEIEDTRHSIIIVPNVPIIQSKVIQHPEQRIIAVYGNIKSITDLAQILKHHSGYYKILTTPDSFHKVIAALEVVGLNPYNDFFCLIDEVHTLITALQLREKMIDPLKYFFSFVDKSIITATPWHFSDPRFAYLRIHLVTFLDKPKLPMKLVFASDVTAALKGIIRNRNTFPGNLHIFYSCVTGMKNLIDFAEVSDDELELKNTVNLYVSDDIGNVEKLLEYDCLRADIKTPPKKINIYTSKFAEGFDLHDETQATMIIATDNKIGSTVVGLHNTAIQFIGRLRSKKGYLQPAVMHITNTKTMEKTEQNSGTAYKHHEAKAKSLLALYSITSKLPGMDKETRIQVLLNQKESLKQYVNFDDNQPNVDTLPCKLDVFVNESIIKEQYSNEYNVSSEWHKAGYISEKIFDRSNLTEEDKLRSKKNTTVRRERYTETALLIAMLSGETGLDEHGLEYYSQIKAAYPKIFKAVKMLGIVRMKELNFNEWKINKEVESKPADLSILYRLLADRFSLHKEYDNASAKLILQEVFGLSGLLDKYGKGMRATTNKLREYFETETINTTKDAKQYNGVRLKSRKFKLASACRHDPYPKSNS